MDDKESPNQPDILAFGAPRPPARPTRWRRWAAAALICGLAVGGAGVAIAATDTPSPSPTPGSQAPDLGRDHGRLGFGGRHMVGLLGALHGEFVVPKADGGYQTLATQRGKVTGVSKDEITVRSDDGFSKTYAVTGETAVNGGRDGIGSVAKDEQVHVLASVADGKYTALQVVDLNDVRRPFERFGPRGGAHNGTATVPGTPS